MKKKAIKIAASTAVAASAFVAVAPAQQADAATNVTTLATNAQNAGTVLKWAISYEGSADFATRPFNEFNAAKKAVAAAEAAAAKLSTTEKLSLQAKLVDAKIQIVRATAYIDAITSSEKIKSLTSNLNAAIATGDLGKVETAYHAASFEYKKQAKLLDRVYGQSTRDGIRNAVKPAMEAALDAVKYDVTVKMHIDKASALIKEGKLEEAAAELAKADYNLTLKDAKFTFKTQLQKSFDDAAVSLPLQAISAVGDGANTVTVKFSKAYTLDKTLTTLEAGQFKINGLTVQSAKLSEDKKSVVLTTSTQKANTEYTVTWQGKSVSFKTAAVADTSGIAVNETEVAYLETTENRKYTAKLTNTDGTPYVGRVSVKLGEVDSTTTTTTTSAVITTVNGTTATGAQTWTGVTDSQGNLTFTIAAAYGATKDTASVTHVRPTVTKLDGDEKTNKVLAGTTHFFQLQSANVSRTLDVKSLHVDAANDYVYANGFKYKWDANDDFYVGSQKVSQDVFESKLSNGDTVTVNYNTTAANTSVWNITVDVTKSADLEFTNPASEVVTFDGFNYDLSGEGQAGNTVKVYRGINLVGTTTVDSNGKWSIRAVNLTQDAANVFTAYQYLPGKDGVNGVNSENPTSPAKVTVNEGAFAATKISLNDQGVAGLSVNDTLDFSFLNNDISFGHVFKKDLEGTITVSDNLSRKAVYDVEYVDADTLKIVKVVSSETGFIPTSATTIESTTGVVNQDELAFTKSSRGTSTIGTGTGGATPTSGAISNFTPATNLFVIGGTGYVYGATTVLSNSRGDVIAIGDAAIDGVLTNGDVVSNIVVENGVVKSFVGTTVAKEQAKIVAVKTKSDAGTLATTDLAAVTGLTHVIANVTAYQTAFAAKTAAELDTVTELQTIINSVDITEAAAAAQAAIVAVKTKSNAGTLATSDLDAVTGLTYVAANLTAYQTAFATKTAAELDTVSELQTVINSVNVAQAEVTALAAVNAATSGATMKTALDTHATTLGLTGYTGTGVQKQAIADYVFVNKTAAYTATTLADKITEATTVTP